MSIAEAVNERRQRAERRGYCQRTGRGRGMVGGRGRRGIGGERETAADGPPLLRGLRAPRQGDFAQHGLSGFEHGESREQTAGMRRYT